MKLTKVRNLFSIERETLFSKDRSKLLCVSRENMSRAKLMATL